MSSYSPEPEEEKKSKKASKVDNVYEDSEAIFLEEDFSSKKSKKSSK